MNLRKARRELVAVGRALWERRLVTGTSGNVSLRLNDDRLLLTAAGVSLGHLAEDDLVLTDLAGAAQDQRQRPTTEFLLHVAAYKARPDARAVVHAHPTFCVVWSKCGVPLPRDTVGARETLRDVGFVPYVPPGSQALADAVAAALAAADSVLMERHGLTAVAASLEDAFLQTDLAEEAARIAYFSHLAGFEAGGEKPRPPRRGGRVVECTRLESEQR